MINDILNIKKRNRKVLMITAGKKVEEWISSNFATHNCIILMCQVSINVCNTWMDELKMYKNINFKFIYDFRGPPILIIFKAFKHSFKKKLISDLQFPPQYGFIHWPDFFTSFNTYHLKCGKFQRKSVYFAIQKRIDK